MANPDHNSAEGENPQKCRQTKDVLQHYDTILGKWTKEYIRIEWNKECVQYLKRATMMKKHWKSNYEEIRGRI